MALVRLWAGQTQSLKSRQTYEYVYCPIINSAFISMVFRGCLVVHTSGILYTALVEVLVVGCKL